VYSLSHKKRYNYSRNIFSGRAKLFRIIGGPDNQLPDKWSSTAYQKISSALACKQQLHIIRKGM